MQIDHIPGIFTIIIKAHFIPSVSDKFQIILHSRKCNNLGISKTLEYQEKWVCHMNFFILIFRLACEFANSNVFNVYECYSCFWKWIQLDNLVLFNPCLCNIYCSEFDFWFAYIFENGLNTKCTPYSVSLSVIKKNDKKHSDAASTTSWLIKNWTSRVTAYTSIPRTRGARGKDQ